MKHDQNKVELRVWMDRQARADFHSTCIQTGQSMKSVLENFMKSFVAENKNKQDE